MPSSVAPNQAIAASRVLAERSRSSATRPHVEAPLDALGVGVERRVEAALGPAHLAQRPVERVAADLPQARLAGELQAVQVGAREQRVVVEHLLEVRHRPGRVDAVAAKPPPSWSWMPPPAIARSVRKRHRRCSPRAAAGTRSPRPGGTSARRPKPPLTGSNSRRAGSRRPSSSALCSSGSERGLQPGAAGQALAQALAARADLLAALRPGLGDRLQHLRPGRHPVAGLGREVGAAVERQLLGREEHVQRPAAVAGHALHGLHVERVDVRALLAVDLHADELLVHQRGRARILEGLALHHVAPVAGGVADRDEQRLVLCARARERDRPPGQPVDGVLGVLAQVGRGLARQRVGHALSVAAPSCGSAKASGVEDHVGVARARRPHRPRESLTLAMFRLKRLPPRVPRDAACPSRRARCRARRSRRDPQRRRLQLAFADRERAAQLDAGDEREARAAPACAVLEPRVAAAQAAEARAAGQLRVGLQRGADHLAVEVDERVEHGGERPARPAAQPAGPGARRRASSASAASARTGWRPARRAVDRPPRRRRTP